jgi:hypothetical protein
VASGLFSYVSRFRDASGALGAVEGLSYLAVFGALLSMGILPEADIHYHDLGLGM